MQAWGGTSRAIGRGTACSLWYYYRSCQGYGVTRLTVNGPQLELQKKRGVERIKEKYETISWASSRLGIFWRRWCVVYTRKVPRDEDRLYNVVGAFC